MREKRNCGELTTLTPDSRKVEGYALVFNSPSKDLGGFIERIEPTALEGVIEKSDILALLNHNEDKGVLARSKYGEGSLSLVVDDIGLRYSFEAPNTQLGEELLEGLRRGDITTSSFAFTIAEDSWEKRSDGYVRTIKRFKELFDVSPVYKEAYPDTSVALRKLNDIKSTDNEITEDKIIENVAEERNEKEFNNIKNTKKMKFSLIQTINDIVNQRSLNEASASVIEAGANEMRKSGLNYSGQIQLPVVESRDETVNHDNIVAGVHIDGGAIVETEKLNIMEPLRANSVLSKAGATFLTGLVGNISIPTYDGSTVGWAGEVDTAGNGKGDFDSVEFSPKRLCAVLDISKMFLQQDSVEAEEMLKRDIVNAITDKLEATILGDEAGTATKPKGLFNGASATTITYANMVDMEKTLEEANVKGDFKFIVSPTIKADLKTNTISGSKSDLRMIMEGGEVNGYPVISTSNAKGIAFGNWSDLVVAQWGAVDLTVDTLTQAAKGMVRLVVNFYVDAKPRRAESIVAKTKQA